MQFAFINDYSKGILGFCIINPNVPVTPLRRPGGDPVHTRSWEGGAGLRIPHCSGSLVHGRSLGLTLDLGFTVLNLSYSSPLHLPSRRLALKCLKMLLNIIKQFIDQILRPANSQDSSNKCHEPLHALLSSCPPL